MSAETQRSVEDVFAGSGVMQGANIMTRTLLVFGQGATRCHPYARDQRG